MEDNLNKSFLSTNKNKQVGGILHNYSYNSSDNSSDNSDSSIIRLIEETSRKQEEATKKEEASRSRETSRRSRSRSRETSSRSRSRSRETSRRSRSRSRETSRRSRSRSRETSSKKDKSSIKRNENNEIALDGIIPKYLFKTYSGYKCRSNNYWNDINKQYNLVINFLNEKYDNLNLQKKIKGNDTYFVEPFVSEEEFDKIMKNYRFNYKHLYNENLCFKNYNIKDLDNLSENSSKTFTVNSIKFKPKKNYSILEKINNKITETNINIQEKTEKNEKHNSDSESNSDSENYNFTKKIYMDSKKNELKSYYPDLSAKDIKEEASRQWLVDKATFPTIIAPKIYNTWGKYTYKGYLKNINKCIIQENIFYELDEFLSTFNTTKYYNSVYKVHNEICYKVQCFINSQSITDLKNKIRNLYNNGESFKFIKEYKYILCDPNDIYVKLDKNDVCILDLKEHLTELFSKFYNIFHYPFGFELNPPVIKDNDIFTAYNISTRSKSSISIINHKNSTIMNRLYKLAYLESILLNIFKDELELFSKYHQFFENFDQKFLTNNPFNKDSLFNKNINNSNSLIGSNKIETLVYIINVINHILNNSNDNLSDIDTLINEFLENIKNIINIQKIYEVEFLFILIQYLISKKDLFMVKDKTDEIYTLNWRGNNKDIVNKYINKKVILFYQKILIFLINEFSLDIGLNFLNRLILRDTFKTSSIRKNIPYWFIHTIYISNILFEELLKDVKPSILVIIEKQFSDNIYTEDKLKIFEKNLDNLLFYVNRKNNLLHLYTDTVNYINNFQIKERFFEKYKVNDSLKLIISYILSDRQINYKENLLLLKAPVFNYNIYKTFASKSYYVTITDIYNDYKYSLTHTVYNTFIIALKFVHNRGQNVGGLNKDWFRKNYTSQEVIKFLCSETFYNILRVKPNHKKYGKIDSILKFILDLGYINCRWLYLSDELLDLIYIIIGSREEILKEGLDNLNRFLTLFKKYSKLILGEEYTFDSNKSYNKGSILEFMYKKLKKEETNKYFLNKKELIAYLFYTEYLNLPKEDYLNEIVKYLLNTTKDHLIEYYKYNTNNVNFTISDNEDFLQCIKLYYNSNNGENAFDKFLEKYKKLMEEFNPILRYDELLYRNNLLNFDTNINYIRHPIFLNNNSKLLYVHLLKNNEDIDKNKVVNILRFITPTYLGRPLEFTEEDKTKFRNIILHMNQTQLKNFIIATTGSDVIPHNIDISKTSGNIAYHTCFNHVEVPESFFTDEYSEDAVRNVISTAFENITMAGGGNNSLNKSKVNTILNSLLITILSGTILCSSILQSFK